MEDLDSYIASLEGRIKGLSEIEIVRYVYIDLGLKFTFDLNFAFGNKKEQLRIYRRSVSLFELNEAFKRKIVICKSMAYIYKYVLTKLGINVEIVYSPLGKNINHIYNEVILKNGCRFTIDLQSDFEYIRFHQFTRFFNYPKDKLEIIDRKIGYISSDSYYTDESYYLIKSIADSIKKLSEKVEFILNNLDMYNDRLIASYAEFRWYYVNNLFKLLTEKEQRKIIVIDAYYKVGNEEKFSLCFFVQSHNNNYDIYMYDVNKGFVLIANEEYQFLVDNGLMAKEKFPRLRRNR